MLFPDVVMVLTSEVAVDIVKHAFITKFNDISADVSFLETVVCPLGCGAVTAKAQATCGMDYSEFSHLRRNLV